MKRKYRAIVYIEGIRTPVVGFTAKSQVDAGAEIEIELPPLVQFETQYTISKVEEGEEPEESVEDTNELEKVCSIEASGIQPNSYIQIYAEDNLSGEEILIVEGYAAAVSVAEQSKTARRLTLTALGDFNYLQECQMFMADLSRSLGITQGFTGSRQAVSSSSNIVNKLTEKGLVDGLYELLKEAGTGANDFLNLMWRLFRYSQKFAIINNPKALGYFDKTRLKTILNKQLSNISNKQPVIQMILAVLHMIRYQIVEVLAPSFINVEYPDATPESPLSKITDLVIDGDQIKENKLLIIPRFIFSPPPRCNVLFPVDYQSYMYSNTYIQDPTRGFSRVSSTATLTGTEGDDKLIILPEEVKEGVRAHGQYWSSFEEKYRGQRMCAFNYDRPEYIDDFGSDYIRAFMEAEYYTYKYRGNALKIQMSFNLKPILGMPMLILMKNGKHKLAVVEGIMHTYKAGTGFSTEISLSNVRSYDSPAPASETLWLEQAMFSKENIGYHLYPKLLGPKYCYTIFDDNQAYVEDRYITVKDARELGIEITSEGFEGEEIYTDDMIIDRTQYEVEEEESEEINVDEDMSILRILNKQGYTTEEIQAAKKADDAIKNAADAIFEEYNASGNKEKYSYNFGRRLPIGIRQNMESFYKARGSSDKFTFAGGYTLETNSLNLVDEEEEYVDQIGEPIPEDADIGGCYYKEKQEAILLAINMLWSMVSDKIIDNLEYESDIITLINPPIEERPIEEAQADLAALEESNE